MGPTAGATVRRSKRKQPVTREERADPPQTLKKRKPTAVTPAPTPSSVAEAILSATLDLRADLDKQSFGAPTTNVYNPLHYAWAAHAWYTRTYGATPRDILIVGMNPGPWGMAQTGVPFGSAPAVRSFLHMPPDTPIGRPAHEHAKRPVHGLQCERKEVSGDRLWNGWARGTYGDAAAFFRRHFVYSYCPLLFLERSGRNRPANAIRAAERRAMQDACDRALGAVVRAMRPRLVVGVGVWATGRCRDAVGDTVRVEGLAHPSPASPAANVGCWAERARERMRELGGEVKEGREGREDAVCGDV